MATMDFTTKPPTLRYLFYIIFNVDGSYKPQTLDLVLLMQVCGSSCIYILGIGGLFEWILVVDINMGHDGGEQSCVGREPMRLLLPSGEQVLLYIKIERVRTYL